MAPSDIVVSGRVLAFAGLALAGCLEPNPNASDAGASETTDGSATGDTSETSGSSGETDGGLEACDPCELAFSTVSFDAGADGATVEVAKPDQPNTAAIALVQSYAPGGAEALGYELVWTESDEAYTLDVSLSGASDNSRVAGIAVVVGSASEIADELSEVTADACGSAEIPGVGGRVLIHAVEAYDPADGAVASFTGTREDNGDAALVEYCIDASDSPEASLRVRALAFELGDGPLAEANPMILVDKGGGQTASFASIAAGVDVVHLIAATAYDDGSAADLGYDISCDGAAPYTCELNPLNFKGGAEFTAAGAAVGIP